MPEGIFSYVEVPLFFILSAINKESPAANIYDIGTTIGKAPSISISGRDTIPAECKHFCLLFLHSCIKEKIFSQRTANNRKKGNIRNRYNYLRPSVQDTKGKEGRTESNGTTIKYYILQAETQKLAKRPRI